MILICHICKKWNQTMVKQPIAALIYDFDGTL